MIENTLSPQAARRIYDLLGKRYDWFSFYEGRAKERALQLLDLAPGQEVLNAGVGTGRDQVEVQKRVAPGGGVYGIDLSPNMLRASRERSAAPLSEADVRNLPFPGDSFDRIFCAYVLDLIPLEDLPGVLRGFRRVLKPGGRLVTVSMTEGVNLPSRAFVSVWKLAYAVSPISCGGCRPLQLREMAKQAGFHQVEREVVVQLGVPSEILAAN